ncbi:hypothetical protein AALI21_02700 [Corynebacteriaceae bacterium 6-324]
MKEFNSAGELIIQDESINGPLSPVNRKYVDGAVEEALRIDTSVGTRVFAGDVMIFGDTGLRRIDELVTGIDFTTANHHKAVIYREGNQVTLYGVGRSLGVRDLTATMPVGFRPISGEYLGYLGGVQENGTIMPVGNHVSTNRFTVTSATPTANAVVTFKISWRTNDNWPSSLPGVPA